jgi:hypothetical protein
MKFALFNEYRQWNCFTEPLRAESTCVAGSISVLIGLTCNGCAVPIKRNSKRPLPHCWLSRLLPHAGERAAVWPPIWLPWIIESILNTNGPSLSLSHRADAYQFQQHAIHPLILQPSFSERIERPPSARSAAVDQFAAALHFAYVRVHYIAATISS